MLIRSWSKKRVRRPIVYISQSLPLAALEILVHLKQTNDIAPFNAFAAEIPDDLILRPTTYPAHWQSINSLSQSLGNRWLESRRSPALLVLTTITPGRMECFVEPISSQILFGLGDVWTDATYLRRASAALEVDLNFQRLDI